MAGETRRGASLGEAWARVTARPWLLLALAAVNVGLSMLLASPLSAMLSPLMDSRPAAATMVSGADHGYTTELLMDHPEILLVAVTAMAAGLLIYGLLSWVLAGGVLAALALDGDRRAVGFAAVLAEAGRRAGRMLKIGLLGLPLRIVPLLFGGIGYLILHLVIKGRTYQPVSIVGMLSLVIGAVMWTLVSIALDYARGLSLETTTAGSLRLVLHGIEVAFVRPTATLQLIAFAMAGWLAVGVIYFLVSGAVQLWFVLLVLRLLSVVARATITATTMTAAARVARAAY